MIYHRQNAFWHAWIAHIIQVVDEDEIRQHLKKHMDELDDCQTVSEKRAWIASMKNLTYIFEGVVHQDVGVVEMLSRLNKKFLSDPDKYTPPPEMQLTYDGRDLLIPSSFEVERGLSLKEVLREMSKGSSSSSSSDGSSVTPSQGGINSSVS